MFVEIRSHTWSDGSGASWAGSLARPTPLPWHFPAGLRDTRQSSDLGWEPVVAVRLPLHIRVMMIRGVGSSIKHRKLRWTMNLSDNLFTTTSPHNFVQLVLLGVLGAGKFRPDILVVQVYLPRKVSLTLFLVDFVLDYVKWCVCVGGVLIPSLIYRKLEGRFWPSRRHLIPLIVDYPIPFRRSSSAKVCILRAIKSYKNRNCHLMTRDAITP